MAPAFTIDTSGDINTTTTYRIWGVDYWQYFINTGWTAWQVRKSNWNGRGSRWTDDGSDDLWNHTATQNIKLNDNRL